MSYCWPCALNQFEMKTSGFIQGQQGPAGPTGTNGGGGVGNYVGTGFFGPGFPNAGTLTPDTMSVHEAISLLRQPATYYPIQFGLGIQTSASDTSNATAIVLGNHVDTGDGGPMCAAYSVNIGTNTGQVSQGYSDIAIGHQAGFMSQGADALAIGNYAGANNQAANCIVINATGSELENVVSDTCVVAPIRNITGSLDPYLYYTSASGELTYDVPPSSRERKEEIQPLDTDIIDALLELNPVSFNYKNSNDRVVFGLVAEEVNDVLPHIVRYHQDTNEIDSIEYTELIGPLLKLMQVNDALLRENQVLLSV